MNKLVLITGATSGIGKACAEIFASHHHNLILCGRRSLILSQLSAELKSKYPIKITTLDFDIRKQFEVEKSFDMLKDEWRNIDILINNAGLASGFGPIQEGNISDWEKMIDTNIKGLLYVTRYISPIMKERNQGHIINIGSVAGRETYPNGNVYCATKHAVDSLSKAIRIDLVPYNIKVTQIAPGAAETEFSLVRFHGDAEKAANVYKGYTPLKAEDIADVIYYTTSLPPHVTINDLLVMPTAQASAVNFYKV